MKKCILTGVALLGLWVGSAGLARAQAALAMDYVVTDLGTGLYEYDITLTLTNDDGSWQPGQGFGWIIWGDGQEMQSPISDFTMDSSQFPVGPWTDLSNTGGYHNGPTFAFVLDTWVPSAVGDYLKWTGYSATFLDQDQMLFTSLYTTGGAPIIQFATATLDQGP